MEKDMVNHPTHYNVGKIEVIDYLQDKLSEDEFYGFCIGNALKYISRAKYKGKQNEDLQKAIWYLNRIINNTSKVDNISSTDDNIENIFDNYYIGSSID